mmetsp:Transcript_11593/g.28404  ORF Transcript_11593/g.28404 Transcript_11593/m.28404 type:complete len:206 (+) Transcript_11593:250-867(+)
MMRLQSCPTAWRRCIAKAKCWWHLSGRRTRSRSGRKGCRPVHRQQMRSSSWTLQQPSVIQPAWAQAWHWEAHFTAMAQPLALLSFPRRRALRQRQQQLHQAHHKQCPVCRCQGGRLMSSHLPAQPWQHQAGQHLQPPPPPPLPRHAMWRTLTVPSSRRPAEAPGRVFQSAAVSRQGAQAGQAAAALAAAVPTHRRSITQWPSSWL